MGIKATEYVESKAQIHSIINIAIMGIYLLLALILLLKLVKIQNFDQTQEQSYSMKLLAGALVATSTVMQMPVLISIFIIIKCIELNLN